jgi:hypothetical protein
MMFRARRLGREILKGLVAHARDARCGPAQGAGMRFAIGQPCGSQAESGSSWSVF